METYTEDSVKTTRGETRGLWVLLAVWFMVNLGQAIVTGLMDDEAFFWMYGEHLAWGYYEHPPLVALLIKAGYSILHTEAGVRLLFVVCTTVTVFLIARLAAVKHYLLLGILLFSTLIANAGAFLAAPDVPLLLFTALFFLFYKRFLEREDAGSVLLLGIAMAGLIYSKYNGILVILLTILSNPGLLARKRFYLAAGFGMILFLPHILWQVTHDFPTIRYHLVERNVHEHDHLVYFLEYIAGQFGIYGPLTAIFLFWLTVGSKPADRFDRSLKFTAIGILLFFLLYAWRGKIEPNWTLPAFVPMVILTVRSLTDRKRIRAVFYPLAAVSLVMIIGLRVYLVHDFLHLPRKLVNLTEFYRKASWADFIAGKSGGSPVIFFNSYQKAAKYTFYTGQPVFNICDYDNHLTQFNYWDEMIGELQGRRVMVVDNGNWRYIPDKQGMQTPAGDSLWFAFVDDFSSYTTVPLEITDETLRFPAGTEVEIPVRLINPGDHPLRLDRNPDQHTLLVHSIHQGQEILVREWPGPDLTFEVVPVQGYDTVIRVRTPPAPGLYEFYISLKTGWLPAGQNANRFTLEVY